MQFSCKNRFRGLSATSLCGWPGILAVAVLALDQFSKWLVCRVWPQPGSGEVIVVPGFFRLVHWRNLGAAWGIFAEHTWLLALGSALALAVLVVFFNFFTEGKARLALPFGVLIGGIAGNLVDRAFFKEGVVDFIRFDFWPAFNVADSAICCSVIFLVISELCCGRRRKNGDVCK